MVQRLQIYCVLNIKLFILWSTMIYLFILTTAAFCLLSLGIFKETTHTPELHFQFLDLKNR